MATSDGFRALVADHLAPMPGVSIKRMFGGLGVFRGGMMFAMVMDDTLHFRADEMTRDAYEAEGCFSFEYRAKKSGRLMAMPYWRVPERLLDDGEELRAWAELAFTAAERAKGPNAEKTPRKARAPAAGAEAPDVGSASKRKRAVRA